MRYLSTKRQISMLNILAAVIVTIAYLSWGLWLIDRKWVSDSDLDNGFFWSIIPVALLTWYALHLAGA
jgi:hypothetical protein